MGPTIAGRFYARGNSFHQSDDSGAADLERHHSFEGHMDSDIQDPVYSDGLEEDESEHEPRQQRMHAQGEQHNLGSDQARLIAERVLQLEPPFSPELKQHKDSSYQMPPQNLQPGMSESEEMSDNHEEISMAPERLPKRTASVAERSPLQKLEVRLTEISKEEKRARMIQAEQRAMQRSSIQSEPPITILSQQSSNRTVPRKPLPSSDYRDGNGSKRRSGEATSQYGAGSPGSRPTQESQSKMVEHPTAKSTHNGQPDRTRPPARTLSSRSQANVHGYDASRTGGAAAAAVEAYQVVRQGRYSLSASSPTTATDHQARARAEPRERNTTNEPRVNNQRGHSQLQDERQAARFQERGTRSESDQDEEYEEADNHTEVDADEAPERPSRQHDSWEKRTLGERIADRFKPETAELVPPEEVRRKADSGPEYERPPQTVAGAQARDNVGFGDEESEVRPQEKQRDDNRRIHFADILGGHGDRRYEATETLDEWREADTAVLRHDHSAGNRSLNHERGMRSGVQHRATMPDSFEPGLFLLCGPLLRYTGMNDGYWRGSVLIVTQDSGSVYSPKPVLRLFKQPLDLLPPPPQTVSAAPAQQLQDEYVDPLAGQVKISQTGQALHVRPVHHLHGGVDLSHLPVNQGVFENYPTAEGGRTVRSRVHEVDGEATGNYQEVDGVRLHVEHGVTFWRFNIQVQLGPEQSRIAYRINNGAAVGFWVPARDQAMMNVMAHSCNGFSMSVPSDEFSGPDPLWRDVLNTHQTTPFHCMIGGGDQIYNDSAMRDTEHFQEWLAMKNPLTKHSTPFSMEMQEELELFYLHRYSMWFSQGLFGMAASQIPMVNIWDDHDIIDGFGSYPHHFMGTPVFAGLGAVAFKYYMLFQHQSVPNETEKTEPSWLLGASPGPYIYQRSRSLLISLGKQVMFLGLDCRTERMRDEVLSQETYDIVFDRCRQQIIRGTTKHLLVLLGVPIAYPRLNWLENVLTSKAMEPFKAMGRAGMLGNFVNKFDGGVEILDDLDDHWTAKHHKQERNWFVQELQELAAEKSVRVTIISGDVHLAAVGQFYSNPKLAIPKDRDHRYMPNIISSAIVNTPPPEMMADVLNKRNKVHHLDEETDEDMIPLFTIDVDGKPRKNTHLLPRRNWAAFRQYNPGYTPPSSPPPSREGSTPKRSFSFTRSGSLTRRDSQGRNVLARASSIRKVPPSSFRQDGTPMPQTGNGVESNDNRSTYNRQGSMDSTQPEVGYDGNGQDRGRSDLSRSASYRRRPTSLSRKGSRRDKSGREGFIDLDGGLEVTINCEVDQKDPAGVTTPYRLLVPALFSGDTNDRNTVDLRRGGGLSGLLGSLRGHRESKVQHAPHDDYYGEDQHRQDFANKNHRQAPSDLDGQVDENYDNRPTTADSENNRHELSRTYSQTSVGNDQAFTTASHQRASLDSERFHASEQTLQRLPRSNAPFEDSAAFRRPTSRDRQGPPSTSSKIEKFFNGVQKRYSNSGNSNRYRPDYQDQLGEENHGYSSQQNHGPHANAEQENHRPGSRDRHYYADYREAPLLPTSERQLRTSDKRLNFEPLLSTQPPQSIGPPPSSYNERRVVSGPAAFQDPNNRDSSFAGGPLRSQSVQRQSLPQRSANSRAQEYHNEELTPSNTYILPGSSQQSSGPRDPYAAYDDSDPESPDQHVQQLQPQPQRLPSKFERHYGGFELPATEPQQVPKSDTARMQEEYHASLKGYHDTNRNGVVFAEPVRAQETEPDSSSEGVTPQAQEPNRNATVHGSGNENIGLPDKVSRHFAGHDADNTGLPDKVARHFAGQDPETAALPNSRQVAGDHDNDWWRSQRSEDDDRGGYRESSSAKKSGGIGGLMKRLSVKR